MVEFKQDNITQCITPINRKLNRDGYYRRRIQGKLVMNHRFRWETLRYKIPKGFEINHKCKNRACSNIDHLECLSGLEHTILTNRERYADRKILAKLYWYKNKPTGVKLAEVFQVSFSTTCGWIRGWRLDGTR
jgi:hypothetical protein